MYKILICFCMLFIIILYNIYNKSIIHINIDKSKSESIIYCPKDKNNPLCKSNINDIILYNKLKNKKMNDNNINDDSNNNDNNNENEYSNNYDMNNDNKKNGLNKKDDNTINKKTVEEILESLGKQQLYESSYKCEKIKLYKGVKYFEYMDTDPYTEWDDVQKLCKEIDGYFFY